MNGLGFAGWGFVELGKFYIVLFLLNIMKKLMMLTILGLMVFSFGVVRADYYLVADDESPAGDAIKLAEINSILEENSENPTFTMALNSEITIEDLNDSVVVFLSGVEAIIILGESAPTNDVLLAAQISSNFETLGVSSITVMNTEINSDDLLVAIAQFEFVEVSEVDDTNDCDNCNGFEKAEIECASGFSQEVKGTCKSLSKWQDYASQFCEQYGGPKFIEPSSSCNVGGGVTQMGEKPICTDSDGGEIYYDKGEIKLTRDDGETFEYNDFCIDEGKLNEYSCSLAVVNSGNCLEGCNLDVQYRCAGGCEDGACVQVQLTPEKDEEPMEIPRDKLIEDGEEKELESSFVCGGCVFEKKCYPFGHRKDGKYCFDENSEFVFQLEEESSCENSFECDSNLCIDSQCIRAGFFNRLMNWFVKWFS